MKISGENIVKTQYTPKSTVKEGKLNNIIMDKVTLQKTEGEPLLEKEIPKLQDMAKNTEVRSFGSYAPENRFLWDSWIFPDKVDSGNMESLREKTGMDLKEGDKIYRLYHLDAPKSDDPDDRHEIAHVRQAVSTDMKGWKDVGSALDSGPEGAWDDGPIWTGNIYKNEKGEYLFFYTGRNKRDGELQRLGMAKSKDGINWDRAEKPLLEPDGRYYETTEDSPIFKAWRDPCVVKDEQSGKYLMYFTAKTKDGDEKYKGCIGVAQSDNLEGPYESLPPVLAPGKFAQMEVPQVIQKNGKVYMFFSSMEKDYNPEWSKEVGGPQNGLHCYVGDSLKGPFKPLNGDGIVTGSKDNLYTVKLIDDPDRPGEFVAYGWYMEDKGGQKGLTLAQPMRVDWNGDDIKIDTGAEENVKTQANSKTDSSKAEEVTTKLVDGPKDVYVDEEAEISAAKGDDVFVAEKEEKPGVSSDDTYTSSTERPYEATDGIIAGTVQYKPDNETPPDGGLTDSSTGLKGNLRDNFRTISIMEEEQSR